MLNSDKMSLAAAAAQEKAKLDLHASRVEQFGLGLIDFEVIPFAVETSGALGRRARKFWTHLKSILRTKENYIRQERPCTWSAFTPVQWWSQRISFEVVRQTARMVRFGSRSSWVLPAARVA